LQGLWLFLVVELVVAGAGVLVVGLLLWVRRCKGWRYMQGHVGQTQPVPGARISVAELREREGVEGMRYYPKGKMK